MAVLTPEGGAPVPEEMWWRPPEGVEVVHDLSAAGWIEELLPNYRWATVGSIVPEGFPAYARVFHPAYRSTGGRSRPWAGVIVPVRWSTVAEWSRRIVHPLMQFERIANIGENESPSWGEPPQVGTLPREVRLSLVPILQRFTSTPQRCWFCLWDGFGEINQLHYEGVPRVEVPGRTYLLCRGPLEAVTSFGQSPNIWWPEDRSWCVATEIDLDSTYVGGTEECLTRILTDPVLETLPAQLEDRVDLGADDINV